MARRRIDLSMTRGRWMTLVAALFVAFLFLVFIIPDGADANHNETRPPLICGVEAPVASTYAGQPTYDVKFNISVDTYGQGVGTHQNTRFGRDGTDVTGYGAWSTWAGPAARTLTFAKLRPGDTYTLYAEADWSNAANSMCVRTVTLPGGPTPTPSASVTPTPTPTPTATTPTAGRWNSGVWASQSASQVNAFVAGPRGGVPVGNVLFYTTRDSQATQLSSLSSARGTLPSGFSGASQDLVVGFASWTSDGASTTASQASQAGQAICAVDATPIVRLDWEMNLNDGAGNNGARLDAANFSQWVSRFNLVSSWMKAACPGLRVDFNPNNGQDQTSGCGGSTAANWCSRRAFQAVKANVDYFGIDTYDAWNSHDQIVNGVGQLNESRSYATANGKKFSVPEWGLWTGGAGRGDDPAYMRLMLNWFAANAGAVGYETYFNEPASYIRSDIIGQNPNSRATYRERVQALLG